MRGAKNIFGIWSCRASDAWSGRTAVRLAPFGRLTIAGLGVAALLCSLLACSSGNDERDGRLRRTSGAPRAVAPQPQSSTAPAPAPQTAQSGADRALAEARGKTREQQRDQIRDLILDGVFANIELQEGVPRVFVRPGFYLLTFEQQQEFLAVVFAFAYPAEQGMVEGDKVMVVDSVSGANKGTFTEEGLQLN